MKRMNYFLCIILILVFAEPLLGYRQASFHCLFEGLMSNDKSIKEASILGIKLAFDAFSLEEINRVGGEMAHLITTGELDQNLRLENFYLRKKKRKIYHQFI